MPFNCLKAETHSLDVLRRAMMNSKVEMHIERVVPSGDRILVDALQRFSPWFWPSALLSPLAAPPRPHDHRRQPSWVNPVLNRKLLLWHLFSSQGCRRHALDSPAISGAHLRCDNQKGAPALCLKPATLQQQPVRVWQTVTLVLGRLQRRTMPFSDLRGCALHCAG